MSESTESTPAATTEAVDYHALVLKLRDRDRRGWNDHDSAADAIEQLLRELVMKRGEEMLWRALLARAYSGANLYRDDGEMSDGSALPIIDYVRQSPYEIEAAMYARGTRKLQKAIEKHGSLEAAMAASNQPADLRADDVEAAAKWRALRNCARITAMGAAGVDGTYMASDHCHVALNFWTHNEPEREAYPRSWLDQFVAKAMRLATTKFQNVSCSQCGQDFGPGYSGFSHCESHAGKQPLTKDTHHGA